jgi:ornithine carbamoyltransferase
MSLSLLRSPAQSPLRHFLTEDAIPLAELQRILQTAKELKRSRGTPQAPKPLEGKTLGMIFEKNSTRTRVSFEVGFQELGGQAIYLNSNDMQMGRGETVADTARVLSRFVHCLMYRCYSHAMLEELAHHATIPVINGLSDFNHPCQMMADLQTVEERLGTTRNFRAAWVGDGNNVLNSWMNAAITFGFSLAIACPDAYPARHPRLQEWLNSYPQLLSLHATPQKAVNGADVVVTDTWVSMGDKDYDARIQALTPYQVNEELMAKASRQAIFLHCLPAHRGEEVTDAVMDGPQSAVWDEAENRLHAQKAILLWALGHI